MKIAIDITPILDQYSSRGVGVYTKNILKQFLKNKNHQWYLIGFLSKKINLDKIDAELNSYKNIHFHSLGPIVPSNILNSFGLKKEYLKILRKIKPDFFFTPNFERGTWKGLWKNAVMIHDVIPIALNSFSSKSPIHNFIKGKLYKKQLRLALSSDIIFTNSNYSKTQIVDLMKADMNKIFPVDLGVSQIFTKFEKPEKHIIDFTQKRYGIGIGSLYLIYFSGLEKNKNIRNLLKAFKIIIEKKKGLKLVIISKDFWKTPNGQIKPITGIGKKVYELIEYYKLQDSVILTGEVDEKDMPIIISQAEASINLSNDEGFGLPILESLTLGVPTIASSIPVYQELFHGGVQYVSQNNVENIAQKTLEFLNDQKEKKSKIEKGRLLAKKYSWRNTAKQTLQILSGDIETQERILPRNGIKKKRVTIIAPYFYPYKGGAENYSMRLAENLVKDGYEVDALTSTFNGFVSWELFKGIKIKRFRTIIDQYYLRIYPGLFLNLLFTKSDFYHVQGFGFIWQDFCLIIKRFFGLRKKKFINTPHGPFMARRDYAGLSLIAKRIFTFIQKLYLNWLYDQVIAVNPLQAKWINKEYGISLNKIKTLPIGIDDSHFTSISTDIVQRELRCRYSTVITFLGRFHEYKGVMNLLEAIREVKEEIPGILLVLMGKDAGALKKMKQFVKKYDLEKYVTILEEPTDNKRDQVLELSEIFVFPSQWEAYGIAMLEAMAHKNAVISTMTEGGLHFIENGENGILYKYGKVEDLQKAINKLLIDNKLRKKMIDLNYKKAKSLRWEKLWEDYREIYM